MELLSLFFLFTYMYVPIFSETMIQIEHYTLNILDNGYIRIHHLQFESGLIIVKVV